MVAVIVAEPALGVVFKKAHSMHNAGTSIFIPASPGIQHAQQGVVTQQPGLACTCSAAQAMEQKLAGRDALLAKLKAAVERAPGGQSARSQVSEGRQLSRMSQSFRASKKQAGWPYDLPAFLSSGLPSAALARLLHNPCTILQMRPAAAVGRSA